MGKNSSSRIARKEGTTNPLSAAKQILTISSFLMVLTYVFFIIRRWILITDASLEKYGSGGFINRSILLTNQDILANFTISFDILQAIAILGITIALILLTINLRDQNRKYLISSLVTFLMIFALRVSRVVVIHLDPQNYVLIGTIGNLSFAYYDFAFFIYSTDIPRMVITVLLIISTISLLQYTQKTTKNEVSFIAPVVLFFVLSFYTVTIIFSQDLDTDREAATLYYIHYIAQTFLQIGNIIGYLCIAKKRELL